MDNLAAGLSGLAVGRIPTRHLRDLKRQAFLNDNGEVTLVGTKIVSEEVLELVESFKNIRFTAKQEDAVEDDGSQAEGENERGEEEAEKQEELAEEDPLDGEDIYGIDP